MTETLLPPVAVAGLLLVVSGAAKLRDPRNALEGLGLSVRSEVVDWIARLAFRGLGTVEIVLGLALLIAPTATVTVLVSLLFIAFAVVIEWQRQQPDLTSCGCLGARSSPPSRVHTALNLAFATAAGSAACAGVPSIESVAATSPFGFAVFALGTTMATALAAAVVRDLAPLLDAYKRPEVGR